MRAFTSHYKLIIHFFLLQFLKNYFQVDEGATNTRSINKREDKCQLCEGKECPQTTGKRWKPRAAKGNELKVKEGELDRKMLYHLLAV